MNSGIRLQTWTKRHRPASPTTSEFFLFTQRSGVFRYCAFWHVELECCEEVWIRMRCSRISRFVCLTCQLAMYLYWDALKMSTSSCFVGQRYSFSTLFVLLMKPLYAPSQHLPPFSVVKLVATQTSSWDPYAVPLKDMTVMRMLKVISAESAHFWS